MREPLVICLCLTLDDRAEWVEKATSCFDAQTYENSVLRIVRGVDAIGAKRNRGIRSSAMASYPNTPFPTETIIALWDDDDYSAPQRLEHQVHQLESTGKAVTGFNSMKFTDGVDWWEFTCGTGLVLGTSLCFRKSWWEQHPFLPIQIGCEEAFTEEARLAGQLVESPDLNLMYATIHPGNTSKRDLRPDGPYKKLSGFTWQESRFPATK
jgi:hypothetical protein